MGQADTENASTTDNSTGLKPKSRREGISRRPILFLLLGLFIVVSSFFYMRRPQQGASIPGFPGGGGLRHIPFPRFPKSPNVDMQTDVKARHDFPVLVDAEPKSPADLKKENDEYFTANPNMKSRFITHLLLDKPVYRPGETVRMSVFYFDAHTGVTLSKEQEQRIGGNWNIRDPKDVVIFNTYGGQSENGVGYFEWTIPSSVAGGDFKVSFSTFSYDFYISPAERTFEVRTTRTSNNKINKKLDFEQEGYGAGESVTVKLTVDGPEGAKALFTATVDSEVVASTDFVDVKDGIAEFRFDLPAKMERGEGVVAAKVSRDGALETTSKTIPIITQSLDLGLFPEGGVLVSGANQRVYVEALDAVSRKPVDFTGEVFSDVDPSTSLAVVESVHEGRGVSSLFVVPDGAKRVYFKLRSPVGVAGQSKDFPLRTNSVARKDRVALNIDEPVFAHKLAVNLGATQQGTSYSLGVFKREKLINKINLKVDSVSSTKSGTKLLGASGMLNLQSNDEHYGVLRVTLFDSDDIPLAERLVFRMPPRILQVDVSAVVVDDVSEVKEGANLPFKAGKILNASPSDGVALQIKTWSRAVDPATGKPIGGKVPVPGVVALRVTL